ncbi:hypothetical protein B9479_008198, partial [Cryptococcus floricola]
MNPLTPKFSIQSKCQNPAIKRLEDRMDKKIQDNINNGYELEPVEDDDQGDSREEDVDADDECGNLGYRGLKISKLRPRKP